MNLSSLRSIIYTVRNTLRTLNLDDRISNRMIAHLVQRYAHLFLRREADSRKIWKEHYLFQQECVSLEPFSPGTECSPLFYPECDNWVQSTITLPGTYQSIYGPFVQVISLDYKHKYIYKEISQMGASLNVPFGKPRYFTILNNRIVIPDRTLSQVLVRGIFTEPLTKQPCQSPMDYPLYLPEHQLGDLERAVITDLRNITLTTPEDELPNLNKLEKGSQAN